MAGEDSIAPAGGLDAAAVQGLLDLVGGDPEALAEIVDAFLEEAPQRLAELADGLAGGDATLVGRAAHTLKANAATFGAVELEQTSRVLEAAARADDLTDGRELVAAVGEAWTSVEPALAALRERTAAA